MEYRKLGRSGLKVSELSFGSWVTFGRQLDVDMVKKLMKIAYDNGVNFFDNAEAYARGASESLMGMALKSYRREDLVISTKIFWGGEYPNQTGLSRKHLIEGTKNSLKRLQTDYVDLIFCHRPDMDTPVEETVFAMDYIVRSGMAFYWGTSEWPADRIEQAYEIAEKHSLIPPTMEQPQYSILVRKRFEKEYKPLFDKYGMGTTTWSPLASGILTGKYNEGIPKGSRLDILEWLKNSLTEDNLLSDAVFGQVKKISDRAAKLGMTPSQFAIAWILKNPNVSTVLLGASNEQQLLENLKSRDYKDRLTDEILAEVDAIMK